jgi:hypothetical protein
MTKLRNFRSFATRFFMLALFMLSTLSAGTGRAATEQEIEQALNELKERLRQLEGQIAASGQTQDAERVLTPQELDQKIRVVERRFDLAQEEAASAPVVRAGDSGFSLASSDSNFEVRFRGLVNADGSTSCRTSAAVRPWSRMPTSTRSFGRS